MLFGVLWLTRLMSAMKGFAFFGADGHSSLLALVFFVLKSLYCHISCRISCHNQKLISRTNRLGAGAMFLDGS